MQRRQMTVWVVIAAAMLTFFVGLGRGQLFDEDESLNAECGREMFVRGDWIVPTFNHELRTAKPILTYWFMLTSYHLFGVSEFAARFWSAVLGVGTCVLTYHIGCRLFSRRAGFFAGVILASCMMFTTVARASTPDSILIFFITLALFLYVRTRSWDGSDEAAVLPARWTAFLPVYAVMSVAVLAKGPIGVLLPCCIIGLFATLEAVRRNPAVIAPDASTARAARLGRWVARWVNPVTFFKMGLRMRPDLILLCVALIALPWYVAVGMATDGAWLKGFLGNHNVGRFLEPMENHGGPIFYYLIAIMLGFAPWSVFLPLAVRHGIARLRDGGSDRQSVLFLFCWAGVFVGFFSLARTKLPNYVLPCYPALALLSACLIDCVPWDVKDVAGRRYRWAVGSLAVVGLGLVVGLSVTAALILPGEWWVGLAGLFPLAGGLWAWWQLEHGQGELARRTVLVSSVLFVVVTFGLVGPQISEHQDGGFLADALPEQSAASAKIATFRYSPPGLVYYTERRIDHCRELEDVAAHLSGENHFLATRAERLEQLKPYLPAGVEVIARKRQFLRLDDDIVLLGRRNANRPAVIASGKRETRTR
jgi:4-amino-4-deoxy-L-arabinose transferase-like glycosyltransferase